MAEFMTSNIRNIALMGHGSEGKTTLMESMLFAAGMTDRQGKVEDGTTVSDFDPEEKKRGFSISATYAPIVWDGKVINTIDCPGYFDFVGEMMGPLRVAETAVIVIGGVNGLSVGAEKAWDYAGEHHLGRMFVVNQMDREHANFEKIVAQLREKYGSSVVPILLPLGEGANFRGVVNLLERKAYEGAYKKSKEVPVPADLEAEINESFDFLTEQAASADDDLMMKYLEGEELTHDEIMDGFRKGMKDGSIVPVVACSALTGVGIARLMDLMAKYLPSPAHEGLEQKGKNPKNGEEVSRVCKDEEPFSALVFKTIADPRTRKRTRRPAACSPCAETSRPTSRSCMRATWVRWRSCSSPPRATRCATRTTPSSIPKSCSRNPALPRRSSLRSRVRRTRSSAG